MEQGDLTLKMEGEYAGEFAIMRDAVHNTLGNLTQIIEMTQQNSALVEEVAAASDATEEKAKGLAEFMTFFNIGDTGGGGAPAARPATAPAAAPPAAPAATAPSSAPAAKPGKGEDWEDF